VAKDHGSISSRDFNEFLKEACPEDSIAAAAKRQILDDVHISVECDLLPEGGVTV
jgi:hypothetical protein